MLIESLSPIERNMLPALSEKFMNVDDISKNASQDKTTALRAIGFLKNKGLVELECSEKKVVILGILGINYLKKELPERALLNKLVEKKIIPIGEIRNVCGLNDNEAKIALGTLRNKALVNIDKGRLSLNAKSSEVANKMIEEIFLGKLKNYEFKIIVSIFIGVLVIYSIYMLIKYLLRKYL